MNVREAIEAIAKYKETLDAYSYIVDDIYIYSIEVEDDYIQLNTCDGNTPNIRISKDGERIEYDPYADE